MSFIDETYMSDDAYQTLVTDIADALTPFHASPADRLLSVKDVLAAHDIDAPELPAVFAGVEPWPYTEAFDPDQVKWLLAEEIGLLPESVAPTTSRPHVAA